MSSALTDLRIVTWLALLTIAGCGSGGLDIVELPPEQPTETDPPLEHVGGAQLVPCEPIASVAEPHLVEGDLVEITFGCSSGEDRSAFVATLVTEAEGAELDPQTWAMSWHTGLADGGRWDFAVAVGPASTTSSDQPPETAVATVWVADDFEHPDNVPVVPADYTEEWGLPVVHLRPLGALSEEHVQTTITFMGRTYDAEMKIRGAASVYYPKNSYTLRFGDEDLDADALGLGNADHLVLITPFDDNSYVRQKLAYDLWLAMAQYWGRERLTPRTSFVAVYFDREYWGRIPVSLAFPTDNGDANAELLHEAEVPHNFR